MEVIQCAGIFFAPVCHQAGRVEITCVHFFVHLECERTQLQSLTRYARKNGNHQWSQSIAVLHCQGAATAVDGIVNVWREKNMPGSGRDFLETCELQRNAPLCMLVLLLYGCGRAKLYRNHTAIKLQAAKGGEKS